MVINEPRSFISLRKFVVSFSILFLLIIFNGSFSFDSYSSCDIYESVEIDVYEEGEIEYDSENHIVSTEGEIKVNNPSNLTIYLFDLPIKRESNIEIISEDFDYFSHSFNVFRIEPNSTYTIDYYLDGVFSNDYLNNSNYNYDGDDAFIYNLIDLDNDLYKPTAQTNFVPRLKFHGANQTLIDSGENDERLVSLEFENPTPFLLEVNTLEVVNLDPSDYREPFDLDTENETVEHFQKIFFNSNNSFEEFYEETKKMNMSLQYSEILYNKMQNGTLNESSLSFFDQDPKICPNENYLVDLFFDADLEKELFWAFPDISIADFLFNFTSDISYGPISRDRPSPSPSPTDPIEDVPEEEGDFRVIRNYEFLNGNVRVDYSFINTYDYDKNFTFDQDFSGYTLVSSTDSLNLFNSSFEYSSSVDANSVSSLSVELKPNEIQDSYVLSSADIEVGDEFDSLRPLIMIPTIDRREDDSLLSVKKYFLFKNDNVDVMIDVKNRGTNDVENIYLKDESDEYFMISKQWEERGKWFIDSISPGETKRISYSVSKENLVYSLPVLITDSDVIYSFISSVQFSGSVESVDTDYFFTFAIISLSLLLFLVITYMFFTKVRSEEDYTLEKIEKDLKRL